MLLKLIALTLLVHTASACRCLPDTYQVAILSDSQYLEYQSRVKIVIAFDAASGRAAMHSATQDGHVFQTFADIRNRRVYNYAPPYGCYEMQISDSWLSRINDTRCLPDGLQLQSPIPIQIAQRVNANLFSGRVATENTTVDALISDRCEPILLTMKGRGFSSVSIFGNIRNTPEEGILNPPFQCTNNATRIGSGKRDDGGDLNLGYGSLSSIKTN